jgi:hypothetical protein
MPTLTINGRDVDVDDGFLKLPPDQQNAAVDEIAKGMGTPAAPASGGFGQNLADAGRFGLTAVARGLGGLADFATDPLSPIRRMIDPRLETWSRASARIPGRLPAISVFAATGVPEYEPTTPWGAWVLRPQRARSEAARLGSAARGMAGRLSGLLGQGAQDVAPAMTPDCRRKRASGSALRPDFYPAPWLRAAWSTRRGQGARNARPGTVAELSRGAGRRAVAQCRD